MSHIVKTLKRNNSIELGYVDAKLISLFGYPRHGYMQINNHHMSRMEFYNKITSFNSATKNVTLLPGDTTYLFLNKIAKEYKLSFTKLQEELSKYSNFKEGMFVPETYNFPLGIDEKTIIEKLVEQSLKRQEELSYKLLGRYNFGEWYRYVIIASIIQKESGSKAEMPKVSAVIHNRLKKGIKLQMDGTLNYGKYSNTPVTPAMIRSDSSSYNTYKRYGLPTFAVGSVSVDALKAAIHPANKEYLYFVRVKHGVQVFSNTYKEHIKNIKISNKTYKK